MDPVEPNRRSRGRKFGFGVSLVLVLIAVVVVLDPLDFREEPATDESDSDEPSRPAIDPPDPSVFGGAAAGRLPEGAATLWSVDIEHDGDHWVDVIGRDLVIAALAEPVASPLDANAPAPPVTTVVALDAATGEQRWTLRLDAHPRDVTVIGAVDDVLVLEQPGVRGSTVSGVDMVTGETRWSADGAPNEGHVGLVGTRFIARLPSSPDRFVSLIDAASGREVGTIVSDPTAPGRPGGWSTDRRGTWYVVDDGDVVQYDLRTEFGDATVIGPVDDVSMPLPRRRRSARRRRRIWLDHARRSRRAQPRDRVSGGTGADSIADAAVRLELRPDHVRVDRRRVRRRRHGEPHVVA